MANMFSGASNVAIAGGTFTINQTSNTQTTTVHTSAFDKLTAAAAHSALHDAPARTDETRCHRHTRTNVLDHLERWAQGIYDESASVFWLQGGAGAGKSAVMQTLIERCVAQKLALGSFFFFRSDMTRNSAEVLIPTLVYQLAQLFPSALQILDPIINGDPLIFKKSFQVQLLGLFVPALHHLVQLGIISDAPQSPRVFLIDGLDECDNVAQQKAIIQAVAALCHEHRFPVKFLIASRKEHAISTSFEWFSREKCLLGGISLSEDADAEDDIQRFIEDEFLKICLQHPFRKMIPSEWPERFSIDRLVRKSSCHFIYASTAMRYIWSAKESPVRSLQVVLGLEASRTTSPFSELDALYHHILGSAAHRDKVLQILAHCVYTRVLSSTGIVCFILKCSKDDLSIYIADVSPLVVMREGPVFMDLDVEVLHASLGDFLRDQSRSGSLYVNEKVYLASKLERFFQLFDVCSRSQFSTPRYLIHMISGAVVTHYTQLNNVIRCIIAISRDLVETEEVLERYSLRDFYQCQLRFNQIHGIPISTLLPDVSPLLVLVYRMKTPNAARLRKSFAEDYFNILDSYVMHLESMPFGPVIVTLAFSGYPAQDIRQILGDHFGDMPITTLMSNDMYHNYIWKTEGLDIMATADPTSVHHSTKTSPKRLAMAAEAILDDLIHQGNLQFLSTHSTYQSWLRRTKPGKHTAIGAPRLASVFNTLCLRKLRQWEWRQWRDPDSSSMFQGIKSYVPSRSTLQALSMVLGPRYGLGSNMQHWKRWRGGVQIIVDLFKALLWLLPKAGFSEKIILYSKRTFPWNIYQRQPGLICRVHKSLDRYAARVRNEKLEEFGRKIANGDVNALIEKSRMLYLDAQD